MIGEGRGAVSVATEVVTGVGVVVVAAEGDAAVRRAPPCANPGGTCLDSSHSRRTSMWLLPQSPTATTTKLRSGASPKRSRSRARAFQIQYYLSRRGTSLIMFWYEKSLVVGRQVLGLF